MVKATGTYTITDLYDGENGSSAIQAVLSNENHTLTANASGVPTSYDGCETTITVYEGTNDITSQFVIARSAPSGITTTISGNTITVTNVSNGIGGVVTITATKGSIVLTKLFTISVSKTGAGGTAAKSCKISASSQIFKSTTGPTGTYTPDYIYLYPSFQSCSYGTNGWKYSLNGGVNWVAVVSSANGLVIGTFNNIPQTLRIANTCDLFTSERTSISFRCDSTAPSIAYDIITITKLYDNSDSSIYVSDEEPENPTDGMLWYNTNDNTLRLYDAELEDWVYQDVSGYITEQEVDRKLVNKNRTWIEQPKAPYYAGDIWTVQDGEDKGKIKTCLNTRLEPVGTYNSDDWFTPLDAYTTVTQMKNVIGKDPSEWSTESSSLTQLINENTQEIVGAKAQAAKLAVRASDIEMSFSRTGTMNFLGNSSGQNGFADWTRSFVDNSMISTIRDDNLVSGYGFQVLGDYNHWNSLGSSWHAGNIYNIPPAGDFFVVSFKLRNQCKNSYVMIEAVPYDISNTRLDGGKSDNTGWLKVIPYTEEASHGYILFHFIANKNVVSNLKSVKIAVFFGKVKLNADITTRPEWNDSYINTLIKEGSTYYFGKSSYQKMTVIESDNEPELTKTQVWKCTNNIVDDDTNTYKYLAGFYYELNTDGDLVPVVDSYDITMLDKDNYYKIIGVGWVDVTSEVEYSSELDTDVLKINTLSPIQFGDIMFNGGQMVQTWTPRQDENMWGTNIKFNEKGIVLQSSGRKRQLNETSDIAWQIDPLSGNIVSCIWTLTDSGFITNDIKCYGSFFMGYVPTDSFDETSMESYFNDHKVLEMSKANDSAGQGINEYIYSS